MYGQIYAEDVMRDTVTDKKTNILDSLRLPADLRAMDPAELDALAAEIRERLVTTITDGDGCLGMGGHLASNLGVVELTLALHRVFDSPHDHIIWDVGHQSYVHKLLTGRSDRFDTLRTPGGISGFTKRSESPHDPFGAGHSSTSLSAALGIARAEKLRGSDGYTIAVIGDGAFTGGMIQEALNNCEHTEGLRLIIIINENEMSISRNIGSFAKSISRIRNRPSYFRTKAATRHILSALPLIGHPLVRGITKLKKGIKDFVYGSSYFEDLGLYYLGPIDGNDREELELVLGEAKKFDESVVLHIKTQKGRGYRPAEEDPGRYHSVSPRGAVPGGGFSREFGRLIVDAATGDGRICAITAAMSYGTGLENFRKLFPARFFDVGIAEEHAVTFAAGLAAGGMRPVAAIYSTFLQRAYDNILHDAALQDLPLVLCIDRAGLSVGDGATHHGIFDVSFLSSIPGVTIYTPATYDTLRLSFYAALNAGGTVAVRYPNAVESETVKETFYPNGAPQTLGVRWAYCNAAGKKTPDVVIAVHGRMAEEAIEVSHRLAAAGYGCGIILCEYIKPYKKLAAEVAAYIADGVRLFVTLEEEIRSGGFGMNLCDALETIGALNGRGKLIIATDDNFATPNAGQTVYEAAGVDTENAVRLITNMLE